ncbi:energy-coupling factor transport system ATP-binding protein [Saccharopolyspora antimicrobica]|uniref:Energy-coupling factor transport system ATP-binding protein n=1 Tax=Saccharopolyspora antimicrobica TaxID=455193 RepID=A0A1I4U1J1_9PSEU|nr:ATP-binding cassette domain-containing protein [Saccharopolyspora antimicrobica]RKT88635.1 energy-coupling factor transport system ATP-binding protein [Saccharopolyspora antimicrobica]SFM82785.1 energy-coupling factor transport system ATP-binding protein [Saccharopolyspora antimicrobica]
MTTSTDLRAELRGFGWQPLGRRAPAIDGLDLNVRPGERILLAGPSGAGKSTVIHALAGVLGGALPGEMSGAVRVDGQIGLVLQNPGAAVVADRIGRDVAFGPENSGIAREEIWRRVAEALELVGLSYPVDRPTSALSGGELQRLALAGVLALRPSMLLLDEPTSMLDAGNADRVRTAVADVVASTGASLVVVDHRIGPWLDLVHRVVVLDSGGRIVHDVDPDTCRARLTEELGRAGVWMPGLPAPEPVDVPAALVAPDSPGPRLDVRDLGVDLVARRMRGTAPVVALDEVSTEVLPGQLSVFTGASGAGKSTLLAALAGLVRPDRGSIGGTPVPLHRMSSPELARTVGWVPQNPEHGFLTTSVRQEITRTGLKLGTGVAVEEILEVLGLASLAEANPYRLSGGEQRRVALAAALAHRPGALMLDEPTVGQDRRTWAAITGWVRAAARAGATAGACTHDQALIEIADRETRLERGRVR